MHGPAPFGLHRHSTTVLSAPLRSTPLRVPFVSTFFFFFCRTRSPRRKAELEARLQLGETAEQRRLRERNRVEEADNDLTEDLFGGGGGGGGGRGAGGLSGLALKNMQVCVAVAWVFGFR